MFIQYLQERKGHIYTRGKNIHVFGIEDKRQIVIRVSSLVDGNLLPLHIIFIRSTITCLPPRTTKKVSFLTSSFHHMYFTDHWSTLETCQQFVERILIPYMNNQLQELSLPKNQKIIQFIDCWIKLKLHLVLKTIVSLYKL